MSKITALLVALCISLASTPAHADVKLGDQGQQVREVQYILISHGYVGVGKADGVFGPKTQKALRAWQHVNGLLADGVVGPVTAAKLAASIGPAVATKPAQRLTPPQPQEPCDTECIIRDVWSNESPAVIEKAVRTAQRESGPNLKVDAKNYCCYGLFQIYYSVHRAWLSTFGVNQASELFDPRTNATVALALYHVVKWQPWNGGA